MAIFEYGEYQNTYESPDNLVEIFENSVSKYANNLFIGEKDSSGVYQWVTYAQIAARVDNLRGGLASLGVQAGDTVGIIANNRKEWVIGEMATQGLRAAFVPMYEKELVTMWKYIIKDAAVKVLLVSKPEILEKVKYFPAEIPTLQHIYLIEGTGDKTMAALEKKGAEKPVPSQKPKYSDVAVLIYTSGTTGEPKGVLLSHGNLAENVKGALAWFLNLTEEGRCISMLPWAHSFGITADLHAFMLRGGSIGIMGSVETLIDDLPKIQPSFMTTVPRVFNKVYNGVWAKMREEGGLKLKLFEMALDAAKQKRETGKAGLKFKLLDKIVLNKIRERFGGRLVNAVTGSAPMNVEIAKFFIDVGIPTYDAYGLSETSPAITINSPLMGNRLGSVGKPINKTKVVIDRSRTGDNSDDGEIICFGPQCMIGYHNKPEKTKEVIVEMNGMRGVRTGDRGRLDDDGFLFITGRFKEEYKLANGKYIHPDAVELEMKVLPWILNAMIYGAGQEYNVGLIVPDMKLLGQMAEKLNLSVKPESLFDPGNPAGRNFKELLTAEVQNHLRKTIGSYEIPQKFAFILEDFTLESGMLTQTMKLKRQAVLDKYGDLLNSLYKE
ncbi:MAG TPA: AMP-binding protein [Smithellaceae bacterium]|jgi:long-chain acyl-CoA synthetase|nr:AMP-binding protein [Syntrophaceae bacterium]NMC92029.1 AMP-binding protein [Smithella sp.]HNV57325.1 AMP-binding protein [Smithellaceae bacterium]MBP9531310.1 AMP-binding protein [Syntrophaceae bacterium]HOE21846.1 AMP-binding protein [Smithellaceae bacterium]